MAVEMKLLRVKARSAFDLHKVLILQHTKCLLDPGSVVALKVLVTISLSWYGAGNGKKKNIDHSMHILHHLINDV